MIGPVLKAWVVEGKGGAPYIAYQLANGVVGKHRPLPLNDPEVAHLIDLLPVEELEKLLPASR